MTHLHCHPHNLQHKIAHLPLVIPLQRVPVDLFLVNPPYSMGISSRQYLECHLPHPGWTQPPILFFRLQPKRAPESAGNKPSSSSKTRPHSTWIYFPHPGQCFWSSWVGAEQWLAGRHGPTGKQIVEDAAISDDGKFSWWPELEDIILAPSAVKLLDTVALISPDAEVMISYFF
jgi:hypothetical protein